VITVKKYTKDQEKAWDALVKQSKNASFLFYRSFMEYHEDRFQDHSLTFWENNNLVGALPANIVGKELHSHHGLTYGGFFFPETIKLIKVVEVIHSALYFLYNIGIEQLFIKTTPKIYHELPSDEIDWALFLCQAQLYRQDLTLAIKKDQHLNYQNRRKRSILTAAKLNPLIISDNEDKEFQLFWAEALIPNLNRKHNIDPVHSIDEIIFLKNMFPKNIKQHNIYINNQLMAGCTIFLNKQVAHAQYIAGTEEGKGNGSLDYLFDNLIKNEYQKVAYFDMGICNVEDGMKINLGLIDWKEGFGARSVSHSFYCINTKNFKQLEAVLI
jgi:hypothetical protein